MPTKQEIFNTVKAHLLSQNKQARNEFSCTYLTTAGLKCAIGCLIPDGHPGQDALGGVRSLLEIYPDLAAMILPVGSDVDFLVALQRVHDHNLPDVWDRKLSEIAARYGLEN